MGCIGKRPEGIEPGVDFDAARVGLFDPVVQGVVPGRFPHGAGQPRCPGLERGLVEGIRVRADLQDDRIHFQRSELVENGAGFGLLGGGAETGS